MLRTIAAALVATLPLACAAETSLSVPFEMVGDHAFLGVEMQGHELDFVFDSAADGVALNQAAARRLGLEPTGNGWISGASGGTTVPYTAGLTLGLGTLQLRDILAVQAPLDHLEVLMGRPIDGILGRDVLDGRVVILDHDNSRLEVHPRRGFSFDEWGAPCEVSTSGSIETQGEVELLNGDRLTGTFIVDTGAGAYATFDSTFVRRHQLAERVGPTHIRTGRGFTAVTTPDRVGRVAAINLCGHRFEAGPDPSGEQVPVGLSGATSGSLARPGKAGLIGNSLLKRFNILFDLRRDRIYLRPNQAWAEPVRTDGSGLELVRETNGVVRVNDIVPGSPAEIAGLEIDDRVIAIDGEAVSTLDLMALRDLMRQPYRTVRLDTLRHGEAGTAELALRSLFVAASSP